MKCSYPECRGKLEGDFEEILRQGFGYCIKGHRTILPGSTKEDQWCDCGARKVNAPAHTWYCSESSKTRW